jgi:hypothetical protein
MMDAWLVCLAIGVKSQRVAVRADSAERAFQRAVEYWRTREGVYGEPLFARLLAEGSVQAQTAV